MIGSPCWISQSFQTGVIMSDPANKVVETAQGDVKRYYAKIAGSRFVFSDGFEIHFNYGFYDLKESEHMDEYVVHDENQNRFKNGRRKFDVYKLELDEILGKNPNIYIPEKPPISTAITGNIPISGTKGRVYDRPANPLNTALSEQELRDGERALAAAGAQINQEVGVPGTGMATDVNQGSLDQDILAAQVAANATPLGSTLPPANQVGPGVKNLATLREEAAQRRAGVVLPT